MSKLHVSSIWTVICKVIQSANSDDAQSNKFIEAAMDSLSRALIFDAAVSVPFDGSVNDPLSLKINESITPVCYNISQDFVKSMWSLIKEVIDNCDTETAIKFMMSDFSDEKGKINAGDTTSSSLVENYGAAADYAEQAMQLFKGNEEEKKKEIAYWAISANKYDSFTYVTAFYRYKGRKPYSQNELEFFHSFMPFLSRIYAFSSINPWIAILSNELEVLVNNKVKNSNWYYTSLFGEVGSCGDLAYYVQSSQANSKSHRHIGEEFSFELIKLQLSTVTGSLPFYVVIGCYKEDYIYCKSTWK